MQQTESAAGALPVVEPSRREPETELALSIVVPVFNEE